MNYDNSRKIQREPQKVDEEAKARRTMERNLEGMWGICAISYDLVGVVYGPCAENVGGGERDD